MTISEISKWASFITPVLVDRYKFMNMILK